MQRRLLVLLVITCAIIIVIAYLLSVYKYKNKISNCDIYVDPFKFCANIDWPSSGIPVNKLSAVKMTVINIDPSIELAKINIGASLYMPDMGHGSSEIEVTRLSEGEWEFKNLNFIMDGFWEFQVQVKDTVTQRTEWGIGPITCTYEKGCYFLK